MTTLPGIFVGKGDAPIVLALNVANRHGLIAGATGTGKTVTLQVLAEGFSRHGVPVFMADVKGDLSGISKPGEAKPKIAERAKKLGLKDYGPEGFPVVFWDIFGEQGHPIRATISDMGPLLLARLLELNETQEGVLNVAFKVADDSGLLLLDLKDLRSLLTFVAENAKDLQQTYGNVGKTSVAAIQRSLLVLEQQGGEKLFGEPALALRDFMRTDAKGYGQVNVLAADKLMEHPRLYATFMLWLMSELFEELPEVGDLDKPLLVFFFDEAHLLFAEAPKALLERIEKVVRLVRSKGIGIYFISQNPLDIPDSVLGQLGNRVQHALRAFTPRDEKAVRTAAETFRANPKLDTARAITELAVGEALVSTLDASGAPTVVQRTLIAPPSSKIGPITANERNALINADPLYGKYEDLIDRESAHEQLMARGSARLSQAPERGSEERSQGQTESQGGWGLPDIFGSTGRKDSVFEAMAKSAARSIGSSIGRQIVRGILGSILKSK
jgi:DNA helicase HerA-like ATPase